MSFCIQVDNPKLQHMVNHNDKTLADAIESIFPLYTENAIMMWNYICVPLTYKYDISYMMDDILILLKALQSSESGKLTIHWLPDTFRCDWTIRWDIDKLDIHSQWESTVGHLEILLNHKPDVSLKKDDFIKEWKSILRIVIAGLAICGYNAGEIRGMRQLIEQYRSIDGDGILYKESVRANDGLPHNFTIWPVLW